MAFRLLQSASEDALTQEVLDRRNTLENYKFNLKFGLDYHLGFGRSYAFKMGLRYANPGFSVDGVSTWERNHEINSEPWLQDHYGSNLTYNYQMVEIPLGIKFSAYRSTCQPYVELGVAPTYYSKTIIREEKYDGTRTKTSRDENLTRWNYVAFGTAGGNFSITKVLYGFTQIVARYQLNELRTDYIRERLLGLGLECGLRVYLE